jgi:hypothetical protein
MSSKLYLQIRKYKNIYPKKRPFRKKGEIKCNSCIFSNFGEPVDIRGRNRYL